MGTAQSKRTTSHDKSSKNIVILDNRDYISSFSNYKKYQHEVSLLTKMQSHGNNKINRTLFKGSEWILSDEAAKNFPQPKNENDELKLSSFTTSNRFKSFPDSTFLKSQIAKGNEVEDIDYNCDLERINKTKKSKKFNNFFKFKKNKTCINNATQLASGRKLNLKQTVSSFYLQKEPISTERDTNNYDIDILKKKQDNYNNKNNQTPSRSNSCSLLLTSLSSIKSNSNDVAISSSTSSAYSSSSKHKNHQNNINSSTTSGCSSGTSSISLCNQSNNKNINQFAINLALLKQDKFQNQQINNSPYELSSASTNSMMFEKNDEKNIEDNRGVLINVIVNKCSTPNTLDYQNARLEEQQPSNLKENNYLIQSNQSSLHLRSSNNLEHNFLRSLNENEISPKEIKNLNNQSFKEKHSLKMEDNKNNLQRANNRRNQFYKTKSNSMYVEKLSETIEPTNTKYRSFKMRKIKLNKIKKVDDEYSEEENDSGIISDLFHIGSMNNLKLKLNNAKSIIKNSFSLFSLKSSSLSQKILKKQSQKSPVSISQLNTKKLDADNCLLLTSFYSPLIAINSKNSIDTTSDAQFRSLSISKESKSSSTSSTCSADIKDHSDKNIINNTLVDSNSINLINQLNYYKVCNKDQLNFLKYHFDENKLDKFRTNVSLSDEYCIIKPEKQNKIFKSVNINNDSNYKQNILFKNLNNNNESFNNDQDNNNHSYKNKNNFLTTKNSEIRRFSLSSSSAVSSTSSAESSSIYSSSTNSCKSSFKQQKCGIYVHCNKNSFVNNTFYNDFIKDNENHTVNKNSLKRNTSFDCYTKEAAKNEIDMINEFLNDRNLTNNSILNSTNKNSISCSLNRLLKERLIVRRNVLIENSLNQNKYNEYTIDNNLSMMINECNNHDKIENFNSAKKYNTIMNSAHTLIDTVNLNCSDKKEVSKSHFENKNLNSNLKTFKSPNSCNQDTKSFAPQLKFSSQFKTKAEKGEFIKIMKPTQSISDANEIRKNSLASACSANQRHQKIVVQASTNDLLRCLATYVAQRCSNLLNKNFLEINSNNSNTYVKFDPRDTISWLRSADRTLLLQGWEDAAFINPVNLVFVYLLVRDTLEPLYKNGEIKSVYELQCNIMACLYLAFSYMGNEISYPLKPFLIENDREMFWQRVIFLMGKLSKNMLRINQDQRFFTELFYELKSYSLVISILNNPSLELTKHFKTKDGTLNKYHNLNIGSKSASSSSHPYSNDNRNFNNIIEKSQSYINSNKTDLININYSKSNDSNSGSIKEKSLSTFSFKSSNISNNSITNFNKNIIRNYNTGLHNDIDNNVSKLSNNEYQQSILPFLKQQPITPTHSNPKIISSTNKASSSNLTFCI